MSVNLLNYEQINIIAWAGQGTAARASGLYLAAEDLDRALNLSEPYQNSAATPHLAKLIARDVAESYTNRYDDQQAKEEAQEYINEYRYTTPVDKNWNALEVLEAIADAEYQLSEHPAGRNSPAAIYLGLLRKYLVDKLIDENRIYSFTKESTSAWTDYIKETGRRLQAGESRGDLEAPKLYPVHG